MPTVLRSTRSVACLVAAAAAMSACATGRHLQPTVAASAAPAPHPAPAGHDDDAAPGTGERHAPLASPDRPGYSFAPGTIPLGGLQLETGATAAQAGHQTYRSLGEALLRVGVGSATEVRVSANSYALRGGLGAPAAGGFEDARVGVKQQLLAPHGATGLHATSVGVIVGSSVPSGSAGFGARAWQPEAVVAVNTPVTAKLSLVENVSETWAAASTTPDGRRAHRLGVTSAAWYAFTPRVSGFAEYAGSRLARAGGPVRGAVASHYVDAGVALAPVGHVQLDLRAGAGMNGVANDRFVGAGVTRRW